MLRFVNPENLLAVAAFNVSPYGASDRWSTELIGLYLVGDISIAFAYFSIPLILIHIARRRPDIPFNWLFILFAAFIVSCGSSRLIDIWTLWHSHYWLAGWARAVTAAISLGTVYAIAYSGPQILTFPSPTQIQEANEKLRLEVGERQRVEAQLKQEQQFLQALLQNLSDGIVACNARAELTLFNRATEEFHGLPQSNIPPEAWAQYYNLYQADGKTPLSQEEVPLFRALKGEIIRNSEIAIASQNGAVRSLLASGGPIIAPDGEKIGAVVAMKDISDRKAVEMALLEREEFLRSIYNGVDLAIFVINVEENGWFRCAGLNPTYERLTGMLSSQMHGKTPEELFSPEVAAKICRNYARCLAADDTITYEEELPSQDGVTWWLTSLNPLHDSEGRIYRIVGTSWNITDRKQVDAALKESEKRFYGAFEYAAIGMALVSPEGRWLKVNQALCEIIGYSRKELLELDFQQITHPDDLDTDLAFLEQLIAGEIQRYQMEKRYLHKLGHYVWISLNVSLVRDDLGQPLYFISQINDISDRKAAEIQLCESERRFRALFNSSFQFMGLLQPDGILLEANQSALDFGGLKAEEVLGRPFEQTAWWQPDAPVEGQLSPQQRQLQDAISRAAAGEFVRYEVEVRGAGDTVATIDFSLKPVFDEEGRVVLEIAEGRDITERKDAEAALKESEERWQLALTGTGDGIFDWNIPSGEALMSPLFKEMLGYSDSEIENHYLAWAQLLHPDDRDRVQVILEAHLNGETPYYSAEYRARCKDGSYRWILARGETKWDSEGRPVRMVGSLQNITARKQAEVELQQAKERLQLALEASGDAPWDWDIAAGTVYFSPQWYQMLGYAPEEFPMTFEQWSERIHPEDAPWVRELLQAHLEDSAYPYSFDYRLRTRAGDWKWVGNYGKVVARDEDGKPIRMTGTHKDISERKAAEVQLVEGIKRYQLLAENSSDFIATQNLEGVYLYVSPASRRQLGYEPEELIGHCFYEFLHPEDAASLQCNGRAIAPSLQEYTQSFRMRRRDGSYIWLETNNRISPAPDYNGLPTIVSIARDISDRKQTEATLVALNQQLERELSDRRSKLRAIGRLYRSVINSVKEVIFLTDCTGRWIFLSPAWTEILGFTIEESLNTPLLDYIYAVKDRQLVGNLFQDAISLRRTAFRCEFRCPTKEEGFRWVEMYARVEQNEDGSISGLYGTLNDITERKQAEAILKSRADELAKQRQQIHLQNLQLQQAFRVRSEFLATMSHELRTPLNAIGGFSQMLQLQQYGPLLPRQKDMVDRIFNNSQHLLEMLNEVLDFSKIEAGRWEMQPESFDLTRLTRLTVEELRSLATKKDLRLEVNCQLEDPAIVSDSSGVRRILTNLISNAIKFTDSGCVAVELSETASDRIEICIRDTGIGIGSEELENIFEAFRQVDQSLTRQHSGTGLGLAITQSLVAMMEGAIAVESELGVGTTFRVELPRRVST